MPRHDNYPARDSRVTVQLTGAAKPSTAAVGDRSRVGYRGRPPLADPLLRQGGHESRDFPQGSTVAAVAACGAYRNSFRVTGSAPRRWWSAGRGPAHRGSRSIALADLVAGAAPRSPRRTPATPG